MSLLFIINTPGQAHTWKHVINKLINDGYAVNILARDYDSTPVILSASGLRFSTFQRFGRRSSRLFWPFRHLQTCYNMSRHFSPSIVIGFGVDAAVTAVRLRKPSVVFIDDDHTPYQNTLTRFLGSTIVTPDCFNGDLGRKHIRVRGYKELAYLHPNHFRPDAAVLDELKVGKAEKYIILRFNAQDAIHDLWQKRYAVSEQIKIVRRLEKYARVFISPEADLPPALQPYELKISYNRFHDALYYAQMFVGDTGTATVEAAMLGTPAVFLNRRPAVVLGNFEDVRRYGLLHYCCCENTVQVIERVIDLVRQPHLKEDAAVMRERMLADKADVASFMTDFIENYPESLSRPRSLQAISRTRPEVSP